MHKELIRYGKIAVNLLWAVCVVLLCVLLLPKALLFFMPFLIGWLIAMVAGPVVRFLEDKLKVKRKASSVLVMVVVLAGVIFVGYLAVDKLITEAIGFMNNMPNLTKSIEEDFTVISRNMELLFSRFPENIQANFVNFGEEISTFFKNFLGNMGTPTAIAAGQFVKNIPSVIVGVIMTLLSAYFFTAEKEAVIVACQKWLPVSIRKKWDVVYRSLVDAVGGYFKAQLKIEMWIYLLLVIGLMILNIDYALLIAFGIAILDFLPFFGTGLVMLPWAVLKLLSADYKIAVGLLIIWGVSQLVRQFIQPKIVGDSIGVRPIPTLFLLYIGYKVMGVIGMIIAVPVGIILSNMNEAGIFDTAKTSVLLLVKSLNDFRKYSKEDMEYLRDENKSDGV